MKQSYRPHWWMIAVFVVAMTLMDMLLNSLGATRSVHAVAAFALSFAAVRLDMLIFSKQAAQRAAAGDERPQADARA